MTLASWSISDAMLRFRFAGAQLRVYWHWLTESSAGSGQRVQLLLAAAALPAQTTLGPTRPVASLYELASARTALGRPIQEWQKLGETEVAEPTTAPQFFSSFVVPLRQRPTLLLVVIKAAAEGGSGKGKGRRGRKAKAALTLGHAAFWLQEAAASPAQLLRAQLLPAAAATAAPAADGSRDFSSPLGDLPARLDLGELGLGAEYEAAASLAHSNSTSSSNGSAGVGIVTLAVEHLAWEMPVGGYSTLFYANGTTKVSSCKARNAGLTTPDAIRS